MTIELQELLFTVGAKMLSTKRFRILMTRQCMIWNHSMPIVSKMSLLASKRSALIKFWRSHGGSIEPLHSSNHTEVNVSERLTSRVMLKEHTTSLAKSSDFRILYLQSKLIKLVKF